MERCPEVMWKQTHLFKMWLVCVCVLGGGRGVRRGDEVEVEREYEF